MTDMLILGTGFSEVRVRREGMDGWMGIYIYIYITASSGVV